MVRIIAQWSRAVAPLEALVVLYQAISAKLQQRILMVIKISGEPSVFCSLSTREYSSRVTITKLIYCLKKNEQQRPCAHPWAGRPCVILGVSA